MKRWTPDPHRIREIKALSFMGKMLHDPHLFHLNRHSVSVAFFVGLFIAFLPIPGQIPLAALGALIFRCNLPLAILLVWITNPLTFPFIFFVEYELGSHLLLRESGTFHFELSWHWLFNEFPKIWQPIMLGALIISAFTSCTGYLSMQLFWRWHVSRRWSRRASSRKDRLTQD